MKKHNIFLLILVIINGCSPFGFKQLSGKISAAHNGDKQLARPNFHNIRVALYHEKKRKVENILRADSSFLLEKYVHEEGAFLGKLWSSTDSLSFKSIRGNIDITDRTFTPYTCSLIEKWDTIKIREQERLYSNMLPVQRVYGTRIIRRGNGYSIDTCSFIMFFNVDRDRDNSGY